MIQMRNWLLVGCTTTTMHQSNIP